jgi:Ran GTPase-activating protein (RanGAP) involved in mRNA processing and transport
MLPLFGQVAKGVRSYTALNQLNLSRCGLNDQGISVVANALRIRNASLRELDLNRNGITSAGLHALFANSTAAARALTKLSLFCTPIRSEGAIILADALGCNAMPSPKRLYWDWWHIHDDGLVALVSAL